MDRRSLLAQQQKEQALNAPIHDKPEEPLVNPYRANSRFCWLLALASLAASVGGAWAVLALASEQALVIIPLLLGGTSLAGTVGCAVVYAWSAPMVDRHLDEFRRGEHLARWTYEPGQWTRFAEDELRGKRGLARLLAILFAATGLLLGPILWLSTGDPMACVTSLVVCLGLGLVSALGVLLLGQAAYRHALQRVGVAYLGPEAACYNGTYYCWAVYGSTLQSADLHEGGEMAVLAISFGMDAQSNFTLRIPVPPGKEEEAREFLRRLR